MREILFRGRAIVGDREWLYGDLLQKNDSAYINADVFWCNVDKETIGQFTGVTDKNGIKIFEGDIVSLGSINFLVEFLYDGWRFVCQEKYTYLCPRFYSHAKEGEVIGNIHDQEVR